MDRKSRKRNGRENKAELNRGYFYRPYRGEKKNLHHLLAVYLELANDVLGINNPLSNFIETVIACDDLFCMRVCEEAIHVLRVLTPSNAAERSSESVQPQMREDESGQGGSYVH